MKRDEFKAWWRGVMLITRREVKDQFKDWRIVVPVVGLTLFFPVLMNLTANGLVNMVTKYGAYIVAERIFPFLMMVVGFFPSSISLVVALESFVGERERRTIEPLLVSPLSDGQLYLGKLIAVLLLPLASSYLGMGTYTAGLYLLQGWTPEPELLAIVAALTTVQALTMVSAAVVISTQATSVRAANLLASLIIVPVAMLLQGESLLMFYHRYSALWSAVGVYLVVTVFATRMGLAHFNREDLLGREIDVLNPRWIWQTFKNGFLGDARSLRAWLRLCWEDVKRLAVPSLIAAGLMLAATLWGSHLANEAAKHSENLRASVEQLQKSYKVMAYPLGDWKNAPLIWWHNVRALLVATVGSAFSFGVGGILLPLLTYVVVGVLLTFLGQIQAAPPLTIFAVYMLPHGIIEIPATALFIGSMIHLSAMLASPAPGETLGAFWVRSWGWWWRFFLGVIVPLMGIGACVEACLTPIIVAHFALLR